LDNAIGPAPNQPLVQGGMSGRPDDQQFRIKLSGNLNDVPDALHPIDSIDLWIARIAALRLAS
jgi:hypothetical protein